jgi:Predicted exonuclease
MPIVVSEGQDNRKLKRVGEGLRSRVTRTGDIAYTQSANAPQFIPALFYAQGQDDYAQALALKRALIEEHEGDVLEEIIPGSELVNERGTCYRIETVEKVILKTIPSKRAKESLLSDFKLLHGVRETTENALKDGGYHTIEDLAEHNRFGGQARRFLELVEGLDTGEIIEWIGKRFSKSHPLALRASGFHAPDKLLFVDIETLGLFSSPIIIIGLAKSIGETLNVYQYVLRDVHEEPAALAAFLSHVDAHCALVTYNGRTFDVPYLEQRLAYYQIRGDLQRAHFDALHFARRKWGGMVPDFRLFTLQKHLLGARETDIPGALVPEFYETYLRTQNIGPLLAVIEHNRQDLVALAHIFSRLCEG